MAHAIGAVGTPVFIGENGIPQECNQNLTTGEYFCKFDYKYATYDGNSPGHYKPGSRWIDIPADDIRRKALTIGEPISVKGLNYKASEYHANIKPLVYTVQHDSLVHIALTEFTGTGGGDMVQLWRKIFNSSGTAEWRLVSRFTEKFGNADEVMCCQFMCKAGSQFRFVFYNGTVKHINDSSNCIGKYCYQPMSADEEAFCYLWNDPTKRAKKGFPGGVQITEFVLTGKGGTEDVPDEPPDDPTGGGEVPGGGEAPDPITTDPSVGHDNPNDIQPIYIKDSTTKACEQNSGSATRPVYVKNGCIVPSDYDLSSLAPKDSPTFTGNPTTPTPTDSSDGKTVVNKEYLLSKIPENKSWIPKSGSVWWGTEETPFPIDNKSIQVKCDELNVPVRIPIIESAPYNLYGIVTYKASDQPPMVDIRVDDVRVCVMRDTGHVENQQITYPVFVPKGSKLELTAMTTSGPEVGKTITITYSVTMSRILFV